MLDQIEKLHTLDLPPNLVNQETKILTQNLKKEDIEKNKEKNEKIAKSRIKIGIILNEIAEKNNLKVNDEEIKNEIQKQIRSMPGQEKMIMDYYKKNSNAAASLKGALYEEKIIDLLRKKSKSTKKTVSLSEAEEIIKKNASSNQVETKTVKNPKNKKKK